MAQKPLTHPRRSELKRALLGLSKHALIDLLGDAFDLLWDECDPEDFDGYSDPDKSSGWNVEKVKTWTRPRLACRKDREPGEWGWGLWRSKVVSDTAPHYVAEHMLTGERLNSPDGHEARFHTHADAMQAASLHGSKQWALARGDDT